MGKYSVEKNNLGDFNRFGEKHTCSKLRKGTLIYEIDENYFLSIINDTAATRQNSMGPKKGTVSKPVDLKKVLQKLKVGEKYNSAEDAIDTSITNVNKNNAGFICAVLIDLKVVRIL